jgi:hypothetical protein
MDLGWSSADGGPNNPGSTAHRGSDMRTNNISQRLSSIVFCGALAAALAACGGTEMDNEVPEATEAPEVAVQTTENGLRISCDTASRQYDSICNMYGNSSQQCSTAYDVLHCFCQSCIQ